MKIGGLMTFTLNDYPGKVAAIVFTQGCNFRCPFCHNGDLLDAEPGPHVVSEDALFEFLESRRGRLDGLVISGGEPTLQPDLADFIRRVREFGYAVKLDTNGSRPRVVRELLEAGLLDFVAMDVKAPLHAYERLTGVSVAQDRIAESIRLIAASGVAHEFRTTVVEALLSKEDVEEIQGAIPSGSPHRLQTFRPEHALDPALRAETEVTAAD